MITISTYWIGTDGKGKWKVSRKIDDQSSWYSPEHKEHCKGFTDIDAMKDAENVANYFLGLKWCSGVKITKDGKIIMKRMEETHEHI